MTNIICRQDQNHTPVVFLLDTIDYEHHAIKAWHPSKDEPEPVNVSLEEYKITKGLSDVDEAKVADVFVKKFGMARIRKRLSKHVPELPKQQNNLPIVEKAPANGKEKLIADILVIVKENLEKML